MQSPSRLLPMLSCLMFLFVGWQLVFFGIHYHVNELIDSLTSTSILIDFLHTSILLPLIAYILIQIITYALITYIVYEMATAVGHFFKLRPWMTYWFGIVCLALAIADLLALNSYFFPFSFFAWEKVNIYFLWFSAGFWLLGTIFWIASSAYGLLAMTPARNNVHIAMTGILILLLIVNGVCYLPSFHQPPIYTSSTPNIILIGLDSLRPDFIGYYGHPSIRTPNIDKFLSNSARFTSAYTPLARTFPAWMSILTAQHPKHSGTRNNLADASNFKSDTLAKRLQQAGYFSIYASDEKRFSNITSQYGFDQLAGPSMGVNDFILGGLSDFPLANLLTKLPIAKFILPYNFANRAAAITYDPQQFIVQIRDILAHRPNQPLFLAVHFCLSHWPYTWASRLGKDETQAQQYQHSVEEIDKQLGQLLGLLDQQGLFKNSIVVLLSDHGTALGLPNDTLLDPKNYEGNVALLKRPKISRLSNSKDYTINTAYGQGTDVASLKQYHPLLAFKGFGKTPIQPQQINTAVSLTDIAPTILSLLNLAPLNNVDGISLAGYLHGDKLKQLPPRAFFIETGDSLSEIETDHIYLEKVVAKKIGIYKVNPQTGLLVMDPVAEKAINLNKQRAVIFGDWFLAHYPASTRYKLVPANKHSHEMKMQSFVVPAYDVLVNMHSGQWTIGLDTPFAKKAPVTLLTKKLRDFYKEELK